MEGRKWEELNEDCLLKVFEGVGLESLVLDVPFVCKSWYKISLHPQCWKRLDFQFLDHDRHPSFQHRFISLYNIVNFSGIKFVQSVVSHSRRSVTSMVLPISLTRNLMDYLADECPELRHLQLTNFSMYANGSVSFPEETSCLSEFLGRFINLEELVLIRPSSPIDQTLKKISLHCKNLVSFTIQGYLIEEDAVAIVSFLPKIKFLCMKRCVLSRDTLLSVIRGCRELEVLSVCNCVGLDIDTEILKMASSIKTFKFDGCSKNEYEFLNLHGRYIHPRLMQTHPTTTEYMHNFWSWINEGILS